DRPGRDRLAGPLCLGRRAHQTAPLQARRPASHPLAVIGISSLDPGLAIQRRPGRSRPNS
ncbi:MAG: hypothetical protein PF443_09905, partial [Allgaiera sp.]|nr:hypothetical protein [Allgaiera sp.]